VKPRYKYAILIVALLVFGAVRVPIEAALHRNLQSAGLFPPPLQIGTRDKIGQTSTAVALGGLRTLVATFLNLRAFTFFTERRWADVESTFDLIVDLAPRTRYYWETGSWHMAYNAAADSELPPLRRKEAWRSSIHRGRAFLERGVANNPHDWSILANLGFLLSDANKLPAFRDTNEAFAAAADAYRRSYETGNSLAFVKRAWFYALARIEGREADALAMVRQMHAEGPHHRTPTLIVLLFVLEAWENPGMDLTGRAIELFGTAEKAHEALSAHWLRTRERFPVHGVSAALEKLESQLSIAPENSIFKQPLPAPHGPDEWFRE
jgi:hypothetical protein